MTGPEHWREADLILSGDPCEYGCPHSGCPHEMRMIARAQVHALTVQVGQIQSAEETAHGNG